MIETVLDDVRVMTKWHTPNPSPEIIRKIIDKTPKIIGPNGPLLSIEIGRRWIGEILGGLECEYCDGPTASIAVIFTKKSDGTGKDLNLVDKRNDVLAWCPKCDRIYEVEHHYFYTG